MRKFLLFLSITCLLVACDNGTEEVTDDTKETVETEMNESDYYDIVLDTLSSEEVGKINIEDSLDALQGGGAEFILSGEVYSDSIKVEGAYNSNYTDDVAYESSLKELNEEIKPLDPAVSTIYDIDISTCELNNLTLTCIDEELTKNDNEEYTGHRYEYIFNFNSDNTLKNAEINYAKVIDIVKFGEDAEVDIETELTNFMNDPIRGYFVDISLLGNIYYGNETIAWE